MRFDGANVGLVKSHTVMEKFLTRLLGCTCVKIEEYLGLVRAEMLLIKSESLWSLEVDKVGEFNRRLLEMLLEILWLN
jgi:hypothetical protein